MKIQIRKSIFETNSSSMHAMVIATSDQYEKFKNGQLRIDLDKGKFTKDKPDNSILTYNQFIHFFDDDKEYDMCDDEIYPAPGTIEENLWFDEYKIHYKW